MALDNSNKPDLRLYCGATGSGKGVSIREHLKATKPARLLIWDPLDEYGAFARVRTGKLAPEKLVGKKINLQQSIDALMNMDKFEVAGVTVITDF